MSHHFSYVRLSFVVLSMLCVCALNIQSAHAFGVDIHVPEKYSVVTAGDRLYFEISIEYPENTARKDLRFTYDVKMDDKVLTTSTLLKAVENQASFIDYIVIPETAQDGMHEISVNVTDYDALDANASASFRIEKQSDRFAVYFYILLFALIVLTALVLYQLKHLRLVRYA